MDLHIKKAFNKSLGEVRKELKNISKWHNLILINKSLMMCVNHALLGFYLCQSRRQKCYVMV